MKYLYSEDVIALSGAKFGDVGQLLLAGKLDEAKARLLYWQSIFGDRYYVELHRTNRPHEETYIHSVVPLAIELGIPCVATNDVRFLEPSEFEAHEVRVCIGEGRALDDPRRDKKYSDQQYLKSAEP